MCGKLCFLILVMCLAKIAVLGSPASCQSCTRNSYPYFGTKTPYSYVYNTDGKTMTLKNCKPTQIWILCRHGTRYPGKRKIAQMLNLTHIRDQINMTETCMSKHPCGKRDLKKWKPYPDLVPKNAMLLAVQGKKDLAFLAKRIRRKLPTLFDKNANKNFEFRSTATQRTIASMKSFMTGTFGINRKIKIDDTLSQFESINIQQNTVKSSKRTSNSISIKIVPIANDTLLKRYDTCDSWKKGRVHEEMNAFINGSEMTKVAADVSQRLGLNKVINKDDLLLFYDTCRFERALHLNKPSPWCDLFTDDEMRIFEYKEDLYNYYDVGPGRKINSELGCYPIRDMLDHFTKLEEGYDKPNGVFYFTHSHMVSLFLTTMGIGKDSVPLTAANFQDMDHRNWRISQMVPFAANIAAVFHRCDSSDVPFKVAFYLNENPLTIEGCENGVCDWAQLKKKLGAIAANCGQEIC